MRLLGLSPEDLGFDMNCSVCKMLVRVGEQHQCSVIEYPYFYAWNRMGRKGQLCRVIVRGKMNSCQVEFQDGFQAITSRNALRKVKP